MPNPQLVPASDARWAEVAAYQDDQVSGQVEEFHKNQWDLLPEFLPLHPGGGEIWPLRAEIRRPRPIAKA